MWKCSNGKASAPSRTSTASPQSSTARTPRSIPETAFPKPYLLTETENRNIDDILELLNKHGLTSHQSMNLLERWGRIIEMGQRLPRGADRATHALPLTMFADLTATVNWARGYVK